MLMSWKDTIIDFLIRYGFQIVGAIIILTAGALVARSVGRFTDRWLAKQKLEPPVRTLIVRIVKLVVFALAGVLALEKFGVAIAPMIAGIGVAGAGIALAMQGMLSNVMAGLTIIFTKPFRVGEWIEILGVHGQVANIELFSTLLQNPDGSRVVIPNRKIIGEVLHNYGATRQLDLNVGVASGSDMNLVMATVREVLAANPRVLKQPVPVVGITAVGESAVNVSIQPWVSVNDYVLAQRELYQAIVEQFRAKNIEMPFPQREVRLLNAPVGVSAAA
ncbi:MAG: mechanosensitive ion channel family protein [Verrucomicrobia bacterium]|nr:mechanosensitive ion channel family protein [Verrucomicrobiota bacterium]